MTTTVPAGNAWKATTEVICKLDCARSADLTGILTK